MVLLKITIENNKYKNYISLDRSDYSFYIDEKEILLQAGLQAQVMSIEQRDIPVGNYTQFELYISDKMIKSQNLQSILTQLIPTVSFCLWQIEMNVYEFINNIMADSS